MALGNLWLGSLESFKVAAEAEIRQADMTLQEMADLAEHGLQAYQLDSEDEHPFGDMRYMAELVEDVAVITISGALVPGTSRWNKYMGVTGYGEIREAVVKAAEMENVKSILLDIDSPGGAVTGVGEMASFLKKVDADYKPIYATTGSIMASGGYWLGSSARSITAAELSEVGSIGVIAVHREYTKMLQDAGITTKVIRKGKYKALGNPYEKLSPEAEAKIERELSAVYDVFTRTVAENRGKTQQFVLDNAAEGQVFFGREAKEVGLVDVVGTFDDALSALIRRHASDSVVCDLGEGTDTMGKKATLNAAAQAAIAAGADADEVMRGLAAEETTGEGESEPTTETGAEEEETTTTEATDPEEGEGTDDPESDDEEAAAGGDTEASATPSDPESPPATPPAAEAAGSVQYLTSQLEAAQDKVVDLKVELKEATKKAERLTATNKGLRGIAIASVQRLQVALGGTATDFDSVDDAALMAQYESLYTAFAARFPVGSKAEVPTDEDHNEGEPSTRDTLVNRATRFKNSRED